MKYQRILITALVSLLSAIALAQDDDNEYYDPNSGSFSSPEPLYDPNGNRTVTPSEWDGGYPYRPDNSDAPTSNNSDSSDDYNSTYNSGVAK